MSSKIKYSFIGIAILVAVFIGFHYYAASKAEKQITKLIERKTATETISVQYSDIEVTPFTGKIILSDVTIVFGDHIERSKKLTVDLAYLDVLKFYLGGPEYAIEHLYEVEALLIKPSYVNKSNLQQASSDNLHINFEGQVLDGIRAAVGDTVFGHNQQIRATGDGLNLQFPQTMVTRFKAHSFSYEGSIASGKERYWQDGIHKITMDSLTWTPLESFQNRYGFFMQGFGYRPDAIPFKSGSFRSEPRSESDQFQIHSELQSELALISADGIVNVRQPMGNSQLEQATVTVTNFSPSFKRVLENVEKLLSISLPRNDEGIIINIDGTLGNPQIAD